MLWGRTISDGKEEDSKIKKACFNIHAGLLGEKVRDDGVTYLFATTT